MSEKIILLETHNNLRSALQPRVKRGFDLVCSVVGLIAVFPVMAIIAVLVYIDDPGRVLLRISVSDRTGACFPAINSAPW